MKMGNETFKIMFKFIFLALIPEDLT